MALPGAARTAAAAWVRAVLLGARLKDRPGPGGNDWLATQSGPHPWSGRYGG